MKIISNGYVCNFKHDIAISFIQDVHKVAKNNRIFFLLKKNNRQHLE